MLLFERQGETHLIFTRRTEDLATHKGQISFPGGAWEPSDPSLEATALRETEEELGIDPGQVQILRQLPDVPTVSSNFTITPFLARLAAEPSYRPDEREVAEVIEVPLAALRDPGIFWEEVWPAEEGGSRTVYFYRYGKHIIWGATARILKEYLETL